MLKNMRILLSVLFLLSAGYLETIFATPILEAAQISAYSWEEVIDYAKTHLPLEGELAMKSDGFVFLKVDDQYIHTLFPMLGLQEEGFKEPPYFRSKEAAGAHISVFYENENVIPDELGKVFHFELKQIVIVKASQKASYAVLQVECPELEALRAKYGLSPKRNGHEFHISLAKKNHPKKKPFYSAL